MVKEQSCYSHGAMVTEHWVRMGTCSSIFAAGCEFVKTCNTPPSLRGGSDRFLSLTPPVHRLLFVLCVQETRRRGRKQDEAGKRARERRAVESVPVTDTTHEDVNQQIPDAEDFEQRSILYKSLLHKKASLSETIFHFFLKTEQKTLLTCKDLPCCHFVNAWSVQVFCFVLFFRI